MTRSYDLRDTMARIVHDEFGALGNRGRKALTQGDIKWAQDALRDERIGDEAYIDGLLKGMARGMVDGALLVSGIVVGLDGAS